MRSLGGTKSHSEAVAAAGLSGSLKDVRGLISQTCEPRFESQLNHLIYGLGKLFKPVSSSAQ